MISLYKPYMPQNLSKLNEILHSGALAYGEWGRKFESSLKDFIGCDNLLTFLFEDELVLIPLQSVLVKLKDYKA